MTKREGMLMKRTIVATFLNDFLSNRLKILASWVLRLKSPCHWAVSASARAQGRRIGARGEAIG